MTLLHPILLWTALLVPVAWWLGRRRGAPAVMFAPGALAAQTGRRWDSWRLPASRLPRILQVLGLGLAVVALARPARRTLIPAATDGLDLTLCLDVSSSMDTRDMDGEATRLEIARDAAAAFVRRRPTDRIGLVAFARFPELLCPPTRDHDALLRRLADLAPVDPDGPEDATAIGAAVARSAEALATAPAGRVVVLLTDGEENVATADRPDAIAPVHAGQLCERWGVRVYAIVAGRGSRTADGTRVPLETAPVERMARQTGGAFLRAEDRADVDRVYARIDELETAPISEPEIRVEDRHLPWLLAALACLLLGRILGVGPLRVDP